MIKDRMGNIVDSDVGQDKTLSFLYENKFGKILNKLFVRKFVSNLGRVYMESRFSKKRIDKLVKSHNIDMSEYEQREFASFNDFFTRKILPGKRVVDTDTNSVISPADSKLTVYDIDENSKYQIKGCEYSIQTLLGGDGELAKEYLGGKCLVYRLTVDNYHRYCYPDGGVEHSYRFIPGVYHTVNPIATEKIDVYGKNCRELTLLDTDNFGRIAYIEVGAMMVGRINNNHKERFERGEEKGFFSFGGSTIVLLYKKDTIVIDDDITINSKSEIETVVRYGERVGRRGE
ncbi:MAG: phosphatidylserine decarboxylase [Clostridia bacterium]|nr:phosphatidylserine decarboxylase [Clostridia bacterium]